MSDWASINWAASRSREKRQSSAPAVSRQPVGLGVLSEAKTVMYCSEKVTVQYASHIGPMPINMFLNGGMMWPMVGKA